MNGWRALLPYARRHRAMLGRGLAFTCLLVGARLALPLPLTAAVDRSTGAGAATAAFSASPVAVLSATFVALALVAGMAEHFQRLAFAHFAGRSVGDAREAALVRAQDGPSPEELTTQVLGDAVRVKQGLKGVLNHITVNALLVAGVCAALLLIDLRSGAVALVGTTVLVAVALAGARRVMAAAGGHRERETALAASVHGLLVDGDPTQESGTVPSVEDLDAGSTEADVDVTRYEGLTTCLVHVVLAVTAAGVLVAAGGQVAAGGLAQSQLYGIVAYLLVLHGPAVRLARQVTRIAPLLVSARQLGLVLAVGPARSPAR